MPKPEQQTQVAILEWMALQFPREYEYVVRVGNEGKRTIQGHKLAVRMGLNVGASDLFIAWPTPKYAGLWLELKHDKWKGPSGKTEKDHVERQLNFIGKMRLKGYYAELAVGTMQAIDVITKYLRNEI